MATYQQDGTRRYLYGRSPAEVRAKLAQLKRRLAVTGVLPAPGRRTVNDLLDIYLRTVAPTLKPRTAADYEGLARRYIRPALGRIRLSRLEPAHIQHLYAELAGRGLRRAPAQVHALLHRVCSFGVRWRWLDENPCDRVLKPAYTAPRRTMWRLDQVRLFLDATRDHRFGPLWHLAVFTGARLGELLALRWNDIAITMPTPIPDADAGGATGTITIRRTLTRLSGRWVETPPKTRAGDRIIVLPAEAVLALHRQRARQREDRWPAGQRPDTDTGGAGTDPDEEGGGRVFTTRRGGPLHPADVAHALADLCDRLGLPRLGMHGLRHLHASLLLAQGAPLPDVARRLGHQNAAITGQVYAHALAGRDADLAAQLDRLLAPERAAVALERTLQMTEHVRPDGN